MDWDLLISIISDLVKDDNTKAEIYKRFIESSEYSEKELISESVGQDEIFDDVFNEYFEDEEVVDFLSNEDEDYEFDR